MLQVSMTSLYVFGFLTVLKLCAVNIFDFLKEFMNLYGSLKELLHLALTSLSLNLGSPLYFQLHVQEI